MFSERGHDVILAPTISKLFDLLEQVKRVLPGKVGNQRQLAVTIIPMAVGAEVSPFAAICDERLSGHDIAILVSRLGGENLPQFV